MAHSKSGHKTNDCHNILISSAGLKNDGEHLRRMFLFQPGSIGLQEHVGLCWVVLVCVGCWASKRPCQQSKGHDFVRSRVLCE